MKNMIILERGEKTLHSEEDCLEVMLKLLTFDHVEASGDDRSSILVCGKAFVGV